jgi:hypothetical protein
MKKPLSKEGFDNFVKQKYAWPGGYTMYLTMSDGEPLSHSSAMENYDLIARAIERDDRESAWFPLGLEVNWEDGNLYCVHSNEKIEPIYGDDGDGDGDGNNDDDVDTTGYGYDWHGYGLTLTTPNGTLFLQGEEAAILYEELEATKTDRAMVNILEDFEHMCEW